MTGRKFLPSMEEEGSIVYNKRNSFDDRRRYYERYDSLYCDATGY